MKIRCWSGLGSLGVAALVLSAFAGCASVRSSVMSMSNRDLVGETAPQLEEGAWVNTDSTPDPDVADWRLLVFFKPT